MGVETGERIMPDSSGDRSRRVFPIPEARALKETEIFPATREALWELLGRLDAAVKGSVNRPAHEMLSTSFLISGDRGYGKTTIFLTAAAALEHVEEYPATSLPSDPKLLRDLAGRVVWLETLDLEPVPKGANLLAAVLVRIRDALDNAANRPGGRKSSELTMGGHIEKTWEQLDRLVSDATFMWEETSRTNDSRRERAQQQIKAAEIFARFPQDFKNAIDRVAGTLSWLTPRNEPVLVLPVDNVDRSIEHIYSIVKLCRLASSPRLWFVLAASRPDFQFFLERSFQQEMSEGAGFELDNHAHDLAVARRQAATTMRRAIPRGHQVQIGPIDPETAWSTSEDGYPALHDLLGRVMLPVRVERSPKPVKPPSNPADDALQPGEERPSLLHLFDIGARVVEDVATAYRTAYGESGCPVRAELRPEKALLTHAARMALLNLSPRALRDLKRGIDRTFDENEVGAAPYPTRPRPGKVVGCEEAAGILVDQLRGAIDESLLPYWASEQLHHRILRRNMHDNLVLDLRGSPVGQLKQTHLSEVVRFDPEWPPGAHRPSEVVFSDVHLRKFDDIVLELHDLDQPDRRVPLPANVAGWFMLLHDLLKTFPTPRVISGGVTAQDPVLSPELIVTRHELSLRGEQVWLEFGWTLPEWDTFLDFSLFAIQWRAFLHHLEEHIAEPRSAQPASGALGAERLRLVRAAWVENVCSVCSDRTRSEGKKEDEIAPWSWASLKAPLEKGGSEIAEYEKRVAELVERLKRRCEAAEQGRGTETDQSVDLRRLSRTWEWLRRSLPVLLNVEQSVGVDQFIVADSERHRARVRLDRYQMVREAAMRSSAYRARGEGDRRALPREDWVRSVSDAWLGSWERRYEERRRNEAKREGERRSGARRTSAADGIHGSGASPQHH